MMMQKKKIVPPKPKKDRSKKKSIKKQILISMLSTMIIALTLVGGVGCTMGYIGTQDTLESAMKQTAILAADRISYELSSYKNIAIETGCVLRLSDPNVSASEKMELMQQKTDTYGFRRYNLLSADGISLLDGKDLSDREYFHQAIKGEACVSEPLVSAVTGEVTVIVAAPIWQNGQIGSQVEGVVCFIPTETFMSDIMKTIQISEGGSAYMLDQIGNTIAHPNLEAVRNKENTIREAKTDPSLAPLASIESEMIAGKSGFGEYSYDGGNIFTAYAPIKDTNGWSVAINAPTSDFTAATFKGIIITLVLLAISVLVSSTFAIRLASSIGGPVKACADRLRLLAEGDLKSPVPEINRDDEVGDLVSSTNIITSSLINMIQDIDHLLTEMGNGNFTVESQNEEAYVGEFTHLKESVDQIKKRLVDVLYKIQLSADQVASGANQVSYSAQALAQGATEQASSVEELSATINEISNSSQSNARMTQAAQENVDQAGKQVERSNGMMSDMTNAMDDIIHSSQEIRKIIATIEDIAFQTNILALNAAVEAARAGSAGRGFAVVADEVRNLASKSDQAAKATKDLIERSIRSVHSGSNIVNQVTEALHQTADLARQAVGDMHKVAAAVENEAGSLSQITEGINQIAAVVHTNSATSEESAAASEELSSQARLLQELIQGFELPQNQ